MSRDPIEGRIRELLEAERMYHSYFDNIPVPSWHKKYDSRAHKFYVDRVNEAYTDATGITVKAYEGQPDENLWLDETASIFIRNDLHVVKTRVVLPIEERIVNPQTQEEQYAVGFKWPSLTGRRVTGVWGIANLFPKDQWEEVRGSHPHYLKNKTVLDKRWGELYKEKPPSGKAKGSKS